MLVSVGDGVDPTGNNETTLKPRGGAICVPLQKSFEESN
jgi:hypothetical protein